MSFQVTDLEGDASNVATRDIDVGPVNDAPEVTTTGGSTAYTEGGSAATVDNGLTVSDDDDTNLEGATVSISGGLQPGDSLNFADTASITGSYSSGTLTLTGTASVADYQTALRSITFSHSGDNPLGPKTIEFKANDGDLDSNGATKNIAITPVNDAPTIDATNAALDYDEGDGPAAVDCGLTLTDPDSAQIKGATVDIGTGSCRPRTRSRSRTRTASAAPTTTPPAP